MHRRLGATLRQLNEIFKMTYYLKNGSLHILIHAARGVTLFLVYLLLCISQAHHSKSAHVYAAQA